MKTKHHLSIVCLLLMMSCTQPIYVTGYWYNKENVSVKKCKKIYFVALLNDVIRNATVEGDLAVEAKKRAIESALNQETLPSGFLNKEVAKDAILAKARELNCDVIFTIAVLDVSTDSHYVPGQVVYTPGSSYGYYNSFPSYYDNRYATYQTPGYIVNDKTYFIETNIFDATDLRLIWSIQSQSINPTNLKVVSAAYAKELFRKMDAEGYTKISKK